MSLYCNIESKSGGGCGWGTYLFLEFGVLLLGVDEVEDDVECAGEDEGEKEAEAG
jgi:hypothetical protein